MNKWMCVSQLYNEIKKKWKMRNKTNKMIRTVKWYNNNNENNNTLQNKSINNRRQWVITMNDVDALSFNNKYYVGEALTDCKRCGTRFMFFFFFFVEIICWLLSSNLILHFICIFLLYFDRHEMSLNVSGMTRQWWNFSVYLLN